MSAPARVLPWRRYGAPINIALRPLLDTFEQHHPDADPSRIVDAFSVASDAHGTQKRKSGDPYISHPLAVAKVVAGIGLDDTSICAALLHDAVEDTGVELSDIEAQFGRDVAAIVDGVTKLERLKFDTKMEQQAATFRKMLVAMAKDARVLIIKLADRLHNMRTLASLPQWKQERTAQETIDIYAPLAHRLGMSEIKQQLEDLCFATLHPRRYAEIQHMVTLRDPERDLYLTQVLGSVQDQLSDARIEASVTGRPKHLWSIYEKMVVKGREFNDIYDLIGIRIVVDTPKDCYTAVGVVHEMWRHIPGRFKDYIAMPKFNLYQALHTTVIGPQGKSLEVQIRTREMEEKAEYGVASHWTYKGEREDPDDIDLAWMRRLIDGQDDAADPSAYMADLKFDLEHDEVFVFTPRGAAVTLPVASTPVDFAYAIHTEVGHTCHGARVNGQLVGLDHELASGDAVEIFTTDAVDAGPAEDWLTFVASAKARQKIRQWFSKERRQDVQLAGAEELLKALRREGLPSQSVEGEVRALVAEELGYADWESLEYAIGERHVSAKSVASRVSRLLRTHEPTDQLPTTVRRRRRGRSGASATGVHAEGLDDVMIRLSGCCTPVPPDEIIGFATRGRGVSVHRADCANAVSLGESQQHRFVEVEWDVQPSTVYTALVEIKALDRVGLLSDVTEALTNSHVNIVMVNTVTGDDRVARMRFEFELGDGAQLGGILAALKRIESVYDAYRVLPGAA